MPKVTTFWKELFTSIARMISVGLKPRPRFVRFSGKRDHKSDVGQVKNGRWGAAGLILGGRGCSLGPAWY